MAQRASEEEAWRGLLLPASGLQHDIAAGRLEVVGRMDPSAWQAVFDLGRVGPGPGPAGTGPAGVDDKGVGVWKAVAGGSGGGAGDSEGGAGDEDVVHGTRVRRSELADRALVLWVDAFIGPE